MLHTMSDATASIRELRTNFRAVKRKVDELGRITITDNGEPAYILEPVRPRSPTFRALPDYLARLLAQRPEPMSEEAARSLVEENRGDR